MSEDKAKKVSGTASDTGGGKRPKRRRWLWIALGAALALLLLIALFPSVLSLGIARGMALSRINAEINGKAEMKSLSLGWFSGIRIRGLRLLDAQAQPVIEVESVTVPVSLFALLGSTKKLGTVEVESPRVNIIVHADGSNNLLSLVKSEPKQAVEETKSETLQPLGLDVRGRLVVSNGEISVQPGDGNPPLLLSELNTTVEIESLARPVSLDLKAVFGEEKAPLKVTGSATIVENGFINPDALAAEVKVDLTGLNLAPLSAVARQYGAPLDVTGTLNLNLDAGVRGMNDVRAKGEVALASLTLSDEKLLKGDRPTFEQMSLSFDVATDGTEVRITTLNLDSPVATATASGSLIMPAPGRKPSGSLSAQAEVDLAKLASQLPQTLSLQQGLRIKTGRITMGSEIASSDEGASADLSFRLDDLAAQQAGKAISLDAPVALAAKATLDRQGRARLESLELTSSFAQATGQGDMDRFQLSLTTDLDAAMREAVKFVDLGDISFSGEAELALNMTSAEPRAKNIAGTLALTNLNVSGFTPKPIVMDESRMELEGVAALGKGNVPERVSDLKVRLETPLATLAFSAAEVKPTPAGLPAVERGVLTASAEIKDLLAFGEQIEAAPAGIEAEGRLNLSCDVSSAENIIHASRLSARVQALKIAAEGLPSIQEEQLTLEAAMKVNPDSRVVDIELLHLGSGILTLSASGSLQDWSDAQRLRAKGDMSCDLDRLGLILAALTGQPIEMAGAAVVPFELDTTLSGSDWREILASTTAVVDAQLDGLKHRGIQTGKIAIPIRIKNGRVSVAADLGEVAISGRELEAIPEDMSIKGRIGLSCEVQVDGEEIRAERVEARIESLTITAEEMPTIEEERLAIAAVATANPDAGNVDIVSFKITSSLLNLSGKAALHDWTRAKKLRAEGNWACDFGQIGPLAAAFTGQPIEMSGKQSRPFNVDTSLAGADWRELVAATTANANVYLSRVKYLGIETGEMDIPISIRNGHAFVKLETTIAGGRLLLPADVDCTGASPILSLPRGTMILSDVPLSNDLADSVLARFSPLFKGCVVTGGRVGLVCRELNAPLDKTLLQKVVAQVNLNLKDVRLGSAGLLEEGLDLLGIAGLGLDLPEQNVAVAIRDGRAHQEPMTIKVARYDLTLSGSMGLADSDLDMLLEVPITREIVGGDAYDLLTDETIQIPITGTAGGPRIPADLIRANIETLLKSAGRRFLEEKLDEKKDELLEKGVEKGLNKLLKELTR